MRDEQLKARLSDAFDRFLEGVADNRQVAFDDDGWRLKTDAAEQPDPAQSDSLAELHRWLDARSRSIRLADLLIEVENDLGFSVHFQQRRREAGRPRGGVRAARRDPRPRLQPRPLHHGEGRARHRLQAAQVRQRLASRRGEPAGRARRHRPTASPASTPPVHWGDGTTSASDGQRFVMPQKVLQRTYSTRFNSRPTECTDRDAPFVLDGVLYHESDLDLEEHYTDTHGYTEINFAAFGMVGMRFCPRIRSLHRQRIYCADPGRDHGVLEPVLKRGRRAVNFRLIAEQWDRIGQFYAAFPAGHATASAALQRLKPVPGLEPLLRRQPGARPGAEDRVRAAGTCPSRSCGRRCGVACSRSSSSTPWPGPSTYGQRAHQRPGGLRPGERVLVPDADPHLHRLLAGPGDLTAGRRAGLPVRPRSVAACQPDRVEERHPSTARSKIDPAKLTRRRP